MSNARRDGGCFHLRERRPEPWAVVPRADHAVARRGRLHCEGVVTAGSDSAPAVAVMKRPVRHNDPPSSGPRQASSRRTRSGGRAVRECRERLQVSGRAEPAAAACRRRGMASTASTSRHRGDLPRPTEFTGDPLDQPRPTSCPLRPAAAAISCNRRPLAGSVAIRRPDGVRPSVAATSAATRRPRKSAARSPSGMTCSPGRDRPAGQRSVFEPPSGSPTRRFGVPVYPPSNSAMPQATSP